MTCAGLLGLAVAHGLPSRTGKATGPEAAARGLRYLGEAIDHARPFHPGGHQGPFGCSGVQARDDLYFFWSLERTAMIYDLQRIGEQEWYPWAAQRLVDAQQPDGSWTSAFGKAVDTCFALLVLRRSNLAPDLTTALRKRCGQTLKDEGKRLTEEANRWRELQRKVGEKQRHWQQALQAARDAS
jgi:hypothetical protein